MTEEVQSPCIGVCAIDETNGFCQGCYRTIEEIQAWWDIDDVARLEIVEKASMREAELFD